MAIAAYTEDPPAPALHELKARIETGDAAQAERDLRVALEADPDDPDILNLLGYANRKLQHFDTARTFYEQALAISPSHRGALEYMGELELQTGNAAAAEALRSRLEAACPTGCEELDDLNLAFSEYGF